MKLSSSSAAGINPIHGGAQWDAVDILWCDDKEVDGYLSGDFYGSTLEAGWYFEPLVRVCNEIYEAPVRCEGPRGPFPTSEQALLGARAEAHQRA